jgi:hypothetical protein
MVVYFGLFQVSFQLLLAFKVVDDLKQKGNETKVDRYIAPGPVVWMHSTWTSSAGAHSGKRKHRTKLSFTTKIGGEKLL